MQTLTIYDKESHEPLVVLEQTEDGIHLTGGSQKVAQGLNLNDFQSLEEISEYINSEDSPLQAVADEGSEEGKQSGHEEEITEHDRLLSRIEPALQIIRDLIERVDYRREELEDRKAKDEIGDAGKVMGAEVISEKPRQMYMSMDGDNIGNAVMRAEEHDDESALMDVSRRIDAGEDIFKEWVAEIGGYVVEAGGDEGLARIPSSALNRIEDFRTRYLNTVKASATVGVGDKISEASKARMVGKLRGKNMIVIYDEGVGKELEIRMEAEQLDEKSKISQARQE